VRAEDFATLDPFARYWHRWISVAFLGSYLEAAKDAPFVPKEAAQIDLLIGTFLLEKATYEVEHELKNRPEWVRVALQGVLQLVKPDGAS
jgi:maltose alpha-D-glucosyltransferase/alpha-amylase